MLLSESHTASVNDICVRKSIDVFGTIDDDGFLLVWSHDTMQIVKRFVPFGTHTRLKLFCYK
jgi:hypothetical protein